MECGVYVFIAVSVFGVGGFVIGQEVLGILCWRFGVSGIVVVFVARGGGCGGIRCCFVLVSEVLVLVVRG